MTNAVIGFASGVSPGIKSEKLREKTRLPLAVGFGISTPQHVKEVLEAGADAAIVGSALIQKIEKDEDITTYIQEMKKATKKIH